MIGCHGHTAAAIIAKLPEHSELFSPHRSLDSIPHTTVLFGTKAQGDAHTALHRVFVFVGP